MLKNYLKIAWRHVLREKGYAFINVFGLAIGMASFWLIFQYVHFERSYDAFHRNKTSLYRVQYQQYKAGVLEVDNAAAVPAIGPALKARFPQVVDYSRILTRHPTIVSYQNQMYREERIREVDPSFLRLFSFPLVKGDPATALADPNTAVITEATARKYFGTSDPLGKVIVLNGEREVEIRGVCQDVPPNSHITFDFLIALSPAMWSPKIENAGWYWYDFYTYVQLAPDADPTTLQAALNAWVARERGEAWEREGLRQVFNLLPITDIHLHSHSMQELDPATQGNAWAVQLLLLTGGFILAIAWANSINLATARSMKRAREIGVRKIIGAHGLQLQGQFLLESMMMNLTAATLAVGLVLTATPWLEQLAGRPVLSPGWADSLTGFGIILMGSLLSGCYPALVLTQLNPATILKGSMSRAGGTRLRQGLVTFQFIVSIVLLIGVVTVHRQLTFLQDKNLGITLEQVLVLRGPGATQGTDSVYTHTVEAFKTELLQSRAIRRVTASSSVPGHEIKWMNTITPATTAPPGGENTADSKAIRIVGIDPDYLPAYNISLRAGRNFSDSLRLDAEALILNEAAARLLESASPEQAIGRLVDFRGKIRPIIGVVDDYNHLSPKAAVEPIVFTYQTAAREYFSLKIEPSSIHQTVEQIKDVYLSFFRGSPFEYYFLDDAFNRQYEADSRFGRLLGMFTGLALLVACLGLFGLVMFAAEQRTMEIGVRKVLGASVTSIVALLSKDFLKLVVVAFVVAAPLAYVVMQRWLDSFAYRIEIGPGVFLLTGLLVVLIALLTVSYQAIKAALADPVKSLRYE